MMFLYRIEYNEENLSFLYGLCLFYSKDHSTVFTHKSKSEENKVLL